MTVKFVKGGSSVTFPGDENRNWPLDDQAGIRGKLLRSAGGTYAFDLRMTESPLEIPIVLNNISHSFVANLLAFFVVIGKGLYQFEYTNDLTGEVDLPVTWINGWQFRDQGKYQSGIIVLKKEIV